MNDIKTILNLLKDGAFSSGGGSGSVQVIDSEPFYKLFMAMLGETSFSNARYISANVYRANVDTESTGNYVFSSKDEVFKLFDKLYSKAKNAIENNPSSPAEIDLNMKVICNNYRLYGYKLSAPIVLDNFVVRQSYDSRDSRYYFGNRISCHFHFLSNSTDLGACGISGVVDGILSFGWDVDAEQPIPAFFELNTNLGVFNLTYVPQKNRI